MLLKILGFIFGGCLHEWKIIKTETVKPLKMKDILKLLPKLSSDQFIDVSEVTMITYKCSNCLDFKQKKLLGRVNNGQT